jgi:hypothetical protein
MLSRRDVRHLSRHDINEMERQRKFAREAAEILKQCPKPDIFIGRKTQEPFPAELQIKDGITVGD